MLYKIPEGNGDVFRAILTAFQDMEDKTMLR